MKKTTMLRNLLNEPGLLLVPGAYDCITARCAELVGFKAVFQSGAGVRDSQLVCRMSALLRPAKS